MRLQVSPKLPQEDISLIRFLSETNQMVNGLAEGRMSVRHAAMTAPPTTGSYAVGDSILNSIPSELGSVGSKYVIEKWICTVAGAPGTWVQSRSLTGN